MALIALAFCENTSSPKRIKIMKKFIFIFTLLASDQVFATDADTDLVDCENPQVSYEIQMCLSENVTDLKAELNKVYKKLYAQTEAKKELNAAQKAWLKYRDLQCGDFTFADAGAGSGQISYDLDCQSQLLTHRIDYLKSLLPN